MDFCVRLHNEGNGDEQSRKWKKTELCKYYSSQTIEKKDNEK